MVYCLSLALALSFKNKDQPWTRDPDTIPPWINAPPALPLAGESTLRPSAWIIYLPSAQKCLSSRLSLLASAAPRGKWSNVPSLPPSLTTLRPIQLPHLSRYFNFRQRF